jgi:CheY-like chemotaxis protein
MTLARSIRAALRRLTGRESDGARQAIGSANRQVLIVARDATLTQRVADLVRDWGLDPVVVTSARFGLELAERTEFPLIVCDVPLADLDLAEFVRGLRSSANTRRQGSLLVMAPAEGRSEIQRTLSGYATTVLVRHAPNELLRPVIERLLSVAPRKRPSSVVTARIVPEINANPLACPVVNLSVTGVLVVTQHLLPIGTRCQVELTSESSNESVTAGGWVVRHHPSVSTVDPLHDRMAVRFLEDDGTGRDRLIRFLEAV